MRIVRIASGSVAALALLTTSITPAAARWGGGFGGGWNSWGGGGYGGRHHRRHDDDTGEVLAGVLIGAVLVGVLASASKKSKEARRYPSDARRPDGERSQGRISSENAAVDACAQAAEERGGDRASVRDITTVRTSGDGWDVEGTVEQRSSWRDHAAKTREFTCSVRYGEVDSVYIDGDAVAAR
jgi:hypothetical protein